MKVQEKRGTRKAFSRVNKVRQVIPLSSCKPLSCTRTHTHTCNTNRRRTAYPHPSLRGRARPALPDGAQGQQQQGPHIRPQHELPRESDALIRTRTLSPTHSYSHSHSLTHAPCSPPRRRTAYPHPSLRGRARPALPAPRGSSSRTPTSDPNTSFTGINLQYALMHRRTPTPTLTLTFARTHARAPNTPTDGGPRVYAQASAVGRDQP